MWWYVPDVIIETLYVYCYRCYLWSMQRWLVGWFVGIEPVFTSLFLRCCIAWCCHRSSVLYSMMLARCLACVPLTWLLTVSCRVKKVIISHIVLTRGLLLDLQQLWDRCFTAAGPKLQNSLPASLRQTDIGYEQFKQLLKTFLFGRWDHDALWLFG